jgi:hypothetical protein
MGPRCRDDRALQWRREDPTMSAIVRYYCGQGTDDRGRSLADTQALDASRMEYYHDFIQWMFPLRQPSQFNPGAPILSDTDIQEFHARPELRENLHRSFVAFLRFLGLETREGKVVDDPRGTRSKLFEIPNHNWLRITRVLLCLKTLGLDDDAAAFFAYLEDAYRRKVGITAETFEYWQDAARGVSR